MRSPTHVLFVGLGLQSWDRGGHGGWHSLRTIIRQVKIDNLKLPAVVERIEELFGEGSAEAALAAWRTRGMGTVLVDGGGGAMPLQRVVQAKQNHDRWLAVTPTVEVDLTGQVKTCCQCGENLRPQCDNHFLGYEILPARPKTIEECQRLTNYQVIRVAGFRDLDRAGYIEAFFTWDGESYQDDLFCSEHCTKAYARRAARELAPLPVGVAPSSRLGPTRRSSITTTPCEPRNARARVSARSWMICKSRALAKYRHALVHVPRRECRDSGRTMDRRLRRHGGVSRQGLRGPERGR